MNGNLLTHQSGPLCRSFFCSSTARQRKSAPQRNPKIARIPHILVVLSEGLKLEHSCLYYLRSANWTPEMILFVVRTCAQSTLQVTPRINHLIAWMYTCHWSRCVLKFLYFWPFPNKCPVPAFQHIKHLSTSSIRMSTNLRRNHSTVDRRIRLQTSKYLC